MEKGKYGIKLSFYAVVAFLLVILGGGILPLMLLAGVVIFVEKSEWASRQVIEAICLSVASGIIYTILHLFDFFHYIPLFGRVWSIIINSVNSIVEIVLFIFTVIALIKVAKGQEANVPLASKFANWAYGKVAARPVYTQQPMQQAPVQQPMQQAAPMQQAPVQQAPVQQAAEASACSNCGAPLSGGAFCTKCGTPVAK